MYERALTFAEYVAFYGLSRSEGLVLRYLADAYKALRQTVPDEAKTEDLTDLIEWLGEIVRQVDSSLIDEWERLRNPLDAAEPSRDERPATVTSNVRAFRVLVRNALFHRVRLAALGQYEELGALDSESGWDAPAWEEALEGYFDVHDEIGTGPDARGPALLMIDQPAGRSGRSGRSSTIRRATTTGASARSSTWTRRTRPVRPCCASPTSGSCPGSSSPDPGSPDPGRSRAGRASRPGRG